MGKIVALIPARAGSKGVQHKNLRTIAGKSLLSWSINACLKVRKIDRVVVSTDSEEYRQHSEAEGAEVPFLRPPEISGDKSTDFEFIRHALDQFAREGKSPDFIVHIRPTTPLRDPDVIGRAIEQFTSSIEHTALRSVHEMSETAYKCFEINSAGMLRKIGSSGTDLDSANEARQAFPKTYHANGYVDVLSREFIDRNKRIHGDRVVGFLTPTGWEVDTPADLEFIEWKAKCEKTIFEKIFG